MLLGKPQELSNVIYALGLLQHKALRCGRPHGWNSCRSAQSIFRVEIEKDRRHGDNTELQEGT